MPLELFFPLHEIEAKLAEVQLHTVIVFWRERREVPCLDLISSEFYGSYIFYFCELLMFSQTSRIKFFMALDMRKT